MPLGKQGAGLAPASLLSYLLPAGDVHPQPGTTSTRCIAVRPATVRHIGGVIVVGDGGSSAIALGPPEASAPYSNSGNKPHSMALHLPERSPAFLLPGCELYVYLQAERRKGRERKRQFPYLSFNGASYWAKVVSRGGLSRGSFANPRQGQLQNLVMRKTTKPDDFSFQVQGGKKKCCSWLVFLLHLATAWFRPPVPLLISESRFPCLQLFVPPVQEAQAARQAAACNQSRLPSALSLP